MALAQLELCRVLDRDDPVLVGDRGRERVQQSRLARAGAARDEDVQLGVYAAAEIVDRFGVERSEFDQLVQGQPLLAELTDRDQRSAQAERRDDDVDAAAV